MNIVWTLWRGAISFRDTIPAIKSIIFIKWSHL
jgi:hypothetical protein